MSVSFDQYAKALNDFCDANPVLAISMHPAGLLELIGALQLAMRHPNLPQTTGVICRQFISDVQRQINDPLIRSVIDMGFDANFDE